MISDFASVGSFFWVHSLDASLGFVLVFKVWVVGSLG